MKRRTFLGSAIAAITGTLIPTSADADEVDFDIEPSEEIAAPYNHIRVSDDGSELIAEWVPAIEASRQSSSGPIVLQGAERQPIYGTDENGNHVLIGIM